MNEVRVSQAVSSVPAGAASSKGASDVRSKAVEGGNPLPENIADTVKEKVTEPVVAEQPVDQVVAQMNEFVQNERRDIHFSVDEDSGSTVVRVLDRESGELIRQIPEDVFLRLAREAKENQALQLINVHG